jgi:hypothetical protein
MIAALIYSLVAGWKLTLVYLAMSPLIILGLNLNIKVIDLLDRLLSERVCL